MRHRKVGRKLNRTSSHRKAMLRNLVTALFLHERIKTTLAKAKETRRVAEKLITFAKQGNLASRRQVAKWVADQQVLRKLFETIGPRFADRPGGYTRIIKFAPRLGDTALLANLELIGAPPPTAKSKEEKKGKKEKK
ncbi:MAG: 50S ribosomal protein L17 [Candidatus Edwardsbacteria bacterium]